MSHHLFVSRCEFAGLLKFCRKFSSDSTRTPTPCPASTGGFSNLSLHRPRISCRHLGILYPSLFLSKISLLSLSPSFLSLSFLPSFLPLLHCVREREWLATAGGVAPKKLVVL